MKHEDRFCQLVASAALYATLLVVGCDRPESRANAEASVARRDSAGIELVDNMPRRNGKDAEIAWTVDAAPVVDIGMRDGPAEYLLANVMGAMRLSDGRIVVVEKDAHFRYYDSAGRHDTTITRRGDGPGEVRNIGKFLPYRGDSLMILSGGGAERGSSGSSLWTDVTVYEGAGTLGRQGEVRLARPGGTGGPIDYVGIEAVTPDGGFIVHGVSSPVLIGTPGTRWAMDSYEYFVPGESRLDTIAILPTTDVEETPSVATKSIMPFFRREAPPPAVFGKTMYWSNGDAFEILAFAVPRSSTTAQQPLRIIRYNIANRPADNAVRDRYLEYMLLSVRPGIGRDPHAESLAHRESRATRPARPTLPVLQSLLTDAAGNLWVEHFRLATMAHVRDDPQERNIWTVFDSTGARIGDVVTPTDFKIMQIGRDWMLGTWADADSVQHVRLHRISKVR